MTCKHHFARLLCLGLLLPTLGCSGAAEPVVSEIAAVESCEEPAGNALPRVPSRIGTGKRLVTPASKRNVIALNTSGYGYDVPYKEPAPAKLAPGAQD